MNLLKKFFLKNKLFIFVCKEETSFLADCLKKKLIYRFTLLSFLRKIISLKYLVKHFKKIIKLKRFTTIINENTIISNKLTVIKPITDELPEYHKYYKKIIKFKMFYKYYFVIKNFKCIDKLNTTCYEKGKLIVHHSGTIGDIISSSGSLTGVGNFKNINLVVGKDKKVFKRILTQHTDSYKNKSLQLKINYKKISNKVWSNEEGRVFIGNNKLVYNTIHNANMVSKKRKIFKRKAFNVWKSCTTTLGNRTVSNKYFSKRGPKKIYYETEVKIVEFPLFGDKDADTMMNVHKLSKKGTNMVLFDGCAQQRHRIFFKSNLRRKRIIQKKKLTIEEEVDVMVEKYLADLKLLNKPSIKKTALKKVKTEFKKIVKEKVRIEKIQTQISTLKGFTNYLTKVYSDKCKKLNKPTIHKKASILIKNLLLKIFECIYGKQIVDDNKKRKNKIIEEKKCFWYIWKTIWIKSYHKKYYLLVRSSDPMKFINSNPTKVTKIVRIKRGDINSEWSSVFINLYSLGQSKISGLPRFLRNGRTIYEIDGYSRDFVISILKKQIIEDSGYKDPSEDPAVIAAALKVRKRSVNKIMKHYGWLGFNKELLIKCETEEDLWDALDVQSNFKNNSLILNSPYPTFSEYFQKISYDDIVIPDDDDFYLFKNPLDDDDFEDEAILESRKEIKSTISGGLDDEFRAFVLNGKHADVLRDFFGIVPKTKLQQDRESIDRVNIVTADEPGIIHKVWKYDGVPIPEVSQIPEMAQYNVEGELKKDILNPVTWVDPRIAFATNWVNSHPPGTFDHPAYHSSGFYMFPKDSNKPNFDNIGPKIPKKPEGRIVWLRFNRAVDWRMFGSIVDNLCPTFTLTKFDSLIIEKTLKDPTEAFVKMMSSKAPTKDRSRYVSNCFEVYITENVDYIKVPWLIELIFLFPERLSFEILKELKIYYDKLDKPSNIKITAIKRFTEFDDFDLSDPYGTNNTEISYCYSQQTEVCSQAHTIWLKAVRARSEGYVDRGEDGRSNIPRLRRNRKGFWEPIYEGIDLSDCWDSEAEEYSYVNGKEYEYVNDDFVGGVDNEERGHDRNNAYMFDEEGNQVDCGESLIRGLDDRRFALLHALLSDRNVKPYTPEEKAAVDARWRIEGNKYTRIDFSPMPKFDQPEKMDKDAEDTQNIIDMLKRSTHKSDKKKP